MWFVALIARNLFLWLCMQPLVLFQAVVFVRFPSWNSAAAVALAYATGMLRVGTISAGLVARTRLEMMQGYLAKYQGAHYERIPVTRYLDERALIATRELSHPGVIARTPLVPHYGSNLEQFIEVFVVRRGSSAALPSHLDAYPIPFWGASLFVRDRPEDATAITRFFILHEIGHVLSESMTAKSMLNTRERVFWLLLPWIPFSIHFGLRPVLGAAVLVLALLTGMREWSRREKELRLKDEILADAFAVYGLSEEDRRALSERFLTYLPPRDLSLTDEEHRTRVAAFRATLAEPDGPALYAASRAMPDSLPAQLLVALTATVLVACYAVAPTRGMLWAYGGITGLMLLGYLFTGWYVIQLRDQVDAGRPPAGETESAPRIEANPEPTTTSATV